jgi:hypothetical protein
MVAHRNFSVNGKAKRAKPRKPPIKVADAFDDEGKRLVLLAAHAAPSRNTKAANQEPRPAVDEDGEASTITDVLARLGPASVRGRSHAMLNGDEVNDVSPEILPPADEFVGSAYRRCPDNRLDGVFMPPWVLHIAESGEERSVLAQLAYWFGARVRGGTPRAQIQRNDCYRVVKTYGDLGRETRLTKRQVRYAVDKLRDAQLIATEIRGYRRKPRMTNFRAVTRRGCCERTPTARLAGMRAHEE